MQLTSNLTAKLPHCLIRAGDCDTCCGPALLMLPASCHISELRQLCGNRFHSAWRVCAILCVGLWKRTSVWMKLLSLTKTIAANQQRRVDDTSFVLFTAVNSDDSLERKKTVQRRWPTWGRRERARERKREGALCWCWFLFMVCLSMHLSVVSCPQPLLKIHTEWERCT